MTGVQTCALPISWPSTASVACRLSCSTSLGVARSAVFPVLNVVFTVAIFVRRGLSQQPSQDGTRTGLSAQTRALLEERLADSYAICDQDLPFQLSTRFAEFASVSKHTVYVHQRRYQAAQGLVVHCSHLQETIEQPKATNDYLK